MSNHLRWSARNTARVCDHQNAPEIMTPNAPSATCRSSMPTSVSCVKRSRKANNPKMSPTSRAIPSTDPSATSLTKGRSFVFFLLKIKYFAFLGSGTYTQREIYNAFNVFQGNFYVYYIGPYLTSIWGWTCNTRPQLS